MIEGISHIPSTVQKSAALYQNLFDAEEVYSSRDVLFSLAREKSFLIGQTWVILKEGMPIEKSYNYIASKIPDKEFDDYVQRVHNSGVEIKSSRPHVAGEGLSIYSYDYDYHPFKLHAGALQQRLTCYKSPSTRLEVSL